MPTRTTQTLLANLIDYAGLMPPINRGMRAAANEFARHRQSPNAWILRRFIIPATRLDEFDAAAKVPLSQSRPGQPWSLSVLAEGEFEPARQRIDAFNRKHSADRFGPAIIESVEICPADAEEIARATRVFEGLQIFHELPFAKDPGPLMAAIAACGGGAKIRTGGPGISVDKDAEDEADDGTGAADDGDDTTDDRVLPTSAEIIRFVRAAERVGIPISAISGLAYPLRGTYRPSNDAEPTTMHGFLNVFLAAAAMRQGEIADATVTELLEETASDAFTFTDNEARWRDLRLSRELVTETRGRFAVSFGSSSFVKSVSGLRSLKLLLS